MTTYLSIKIKVIGLALVPINSLSQAFDQVHNTQCRAGLQCNQKSGGYSHNNHYSIKNMRTSCLGRFKAEKRPLLTFLPSCLPGTFWHCESWPVRKKLLSQVKCGCSSARVPGQQTPKVFLAQKEMLLPALIALLEISQNLGRDIFPRRQSRLQNGH